MSDPTAPTAPGETGPTVHAIVAAMAPVQGVPVEDRSALVADLGYDSLRLLELTFALERRFAPAVLDTGRLADVRTVGDLAGLVAQARERAREQAGAEAGI